MWILVWAVLSAFVIAVFIWSTRILQQQKRAWKLFAEKSGMNYESGRLMESPRLSGTLGVFPTDIYTATQNTNDMRGQRYVTVIELNLGEGMPVGTALGTKQYQTLLASHPRFLKSYKPDHAEWDDEYVLKTAHVKKLKAYLNSARLKLILSLFNMKNSAVLLIFDENEGFLHIETTDPLRNVDHISKIMKRLVTACRHLVLTEEEKEMFAKLPEDMPDEESKETEEKEEPAEAALEEVSEESAVEEESEAEEQDASDEELEEKIEEITDQLSSDIKA